MIPKLLRRVEALERRRAAAEGVLIIRMQPDGSASVTRLRRPWKPQRWHTGPEEAARFAAGAVTIRRAYGVGD